jgi:ribonuclease VapC
VIVHTSAIVAILRSEPERPFFTRLLLTVASTSISAGSWVELGVVLARRADPTLDAALAILLRLTDLRIEPVTVEQAEIARSAYRTYGVGSGHAARLNFGDCFAYALAKAKGEPLLFKGDDFAATDIEPAVPPA